jgi:hypothetical protein
LEKQKVTQVDTHHLNPATTAQIDQADGLYLTQFKKISDIPAAMQTVAHTQFLPLAETIGPEKEHGRVTTLPVHLFSPTSLSLDSR